MLWELDLAFRFMYRYLPYLRLMLSTRNLGHSSPYSRESQNGVSSKFLAKDRDYNTHPILQPSGTLNPKP